MTGYIFIHPVILLLIILSLGFILRTVNIFTDRANVLFHNVRIFNWFSK